MFNLESFINNNITNRQESLFEKDRLYNRSELQHGISGKKVLVIGGAGSIGSSFIKAILPFEPSSLVVVDINENALTELTRDLRSTPELSVPFDYVTYPIDYASKTFEKMFRARSGFDIVANFSAHKHVRSEKDIFSVEAMLYNNVINAKKLLDLLSEIPPQAYFCVSTDKAANPVNIMGASKRLMEDLIFSYSDKFEVKTARFANVAFSNGSLPAGFLERISKQQPLSAPNDVKRYFVSPKESGEICMLACILGKNREIFFPKLEREQMMRFDTIAVKLLEEYGYKLLECADANEAFKAAEQLKSGSKLYPVLFSESNTSGEKIYEEFYVEGESVDLERFDSLGVVTYKPMIDRNKLDILFDSLIDEFNKPDTKKENIVRIIADYLPNFKHIETGKSLDSKM